MISPSDWSNRNSRRAVLASTVMIMALLLSALSGCQAKPPSVVIGFNEARNAGLKLRWQTALGLGSDAPARIWRVADTVFVASERGLLFSINADNGTQNWELPVDLGPHAGRLMCPQFTAKNSKIIEITDGMVYEIDAKKGQVDKQALLKFSPASEPACTDDFILIGDLNYYFWALYADELNIPKWDAYSNKDSFRAKPVVTSAGSVIFASRNGLVVARNIPDGKDEWTRKTNGENFADLTADTHAVYVPCLDYKVYSFDVNSGNIVWDTRIDGRLDQPALPTPGEVLVVGTGKGLYALTIDRGDLKWFSPGITSVFAASIDQAYATNSTGQLLALNLDSGEIENKINVPKVLAYATNNTDGTIFILTKDGRVAAYDQMK